MGCPSRPSATRSSKLSRRNSSKNSTIKYHKTNPAEANKIKKWQKAKGFRGSSLKKGGKAKKFLRKVGKGAKVVLPLIFLHDWYEEGFWGATKNTVNDVTWPLSELWN